MSKLETARASSFYLNIFIRAARGTAVMTLFLLTAPIFCRLLVLDKGGVGDTLPTLPTLPTLLALAGRAGGGVLAVGGGEGVVTMFLTRVV